MQKKVKPFTKYCPTAIWTGFCIKLVLQTKAQIDAFWNISNLGVCHCSFALNINVNSKKTVIKKKFCRKCKRGSNQIENKNLFTETLTLCCDVCKKVLGEECGGTFNTAGRCDEGLYCYIRGDPNNDVGTCGKSKTHNFHWASFRERMGINMNNRKKNNC